MGSKATPHPLALSILTSDAGTSLERTESAHGHRVQDRTSLLQARPLSQHTTQRIPCTVESPDYQTVANEPRRCRLVNHLLSPNDTAQLIQVSHAAERAPVETGNQVLRAQHTLIQLEAASPPS